MFTAKSVLLRRQKEAYAEFSKKAGLLPRKERKQVYGFDRSQSSKATWAARKAGKGTFTDTVNALTKNTYRDIMRPEAVRPANEPELLKQFRYVGKDAYTQEEKLKIANPNRLFDAAYTENCQRTVICGELLDRGYDVEALPFVANDAIGVNGLVCWKDNKPLWYLNDDMVITSKNDFKDDIKKYMSEWGEGSRAQVRIQFTNQGDGHFITAKYIDGKVKFYDYQNGKVVNITKSMKKWSDDPDHCFWFMRIDNKEFNENIISAVKSRG